MAEYNAPISQNRHESKANMKDLLAKLTTAQMIATILSGLLIGAFGIVYAYWEFSDRMVQRQETQREKENVEQSETIALMVRAMWVNDLRSLKDSIHVDHVFLMEQAYKKDSVLLIVLPRVMESVERTSRTVKAWDLKWAVVEGDNSKQEIKEMLRYYLQESKYQDSIYQKDAAIMRELRAINRILTQDPKAGDRAK